MLPKDDSCLCYPMRILSLILSKEFSVLPYKDSVHVLPDEDSVPVLPYRNSVHVLPYKNSVHVLPNEDSVHVLPEELSVPVLPEDYSVQVLREEALYSSNMMITITLNTSSAPHEDFVPVLSEEDSVLPVSPFVARQGLCYCVTYLCPSDT